MDSKQGGVAGMLAAMVISGTIGWFVVQSGRPVTDVVFWRCLIGAAVLLPVCAAMSLLRPTAMRPVQWGLAALGGVAIVANWLLLFAAYPRASISVATAVYNTQPFMLVLLGALCLGERLSLTRLGWLVTGFLGVLLIVRGRGDAGGADYLSGVLLALGAAFFYALAALVAKRLKGVPPHLIALVQVTVGAVLLAPFAQWQMLPASPRAWLMLAALGVVHTGLMYILLYGAIQRLPTHLVGALSFVYPVVAILVDLVAFDRALDALQWAGAAAILLAAGALTLGWSPRWPAARTRRAAEGG